MNIHNTDLCWYKSIKLNEKIENIIFLFNVHWSAVYSQSIAPTGPVKHNKIQLMLLQNKILFPIII